MHLEGIPAFLFVLFNFSLGAVSAMVFTVWVFLVRMKKFGYTMNERLEVEKLPATGEEDGPEKEVPA